MKVRTALLVAAAALVLLPRNSVAEFLQQPASPTLDPAQNSAPPSGTQTTNLPPQSDQAPASAPLRVMVGKSLLINTTERLTRVSVTDSAIAEIVIVSTTQILVHGRTPGEVSLLIWDELQRSRSFDLRVDVDVSACAEEEHRVFPEEQIAVTPSRAAIVLSGHVSTEDVAKRAGELASAYSPKVINVLTFGPVGAQEVLLQVKFAEVDRSALTTMGVNFISTGAANTVGSTTTGQFGGVGTQTISQTVGQGGPFSATNSLSNVLNLFLFRPDIHFGAVIEALETKNLLQILSEPNLIAMNGKEASFLMRRPVSISDRAAGSGLHRGHHFIQGIRRQAGIHSGHHAERKYPLEGCAGSEHARLHQRADHLRLYGSCPEHAQGGNRI